MTFSLHEFRILNKTILFYFFFSTYIRQFFDIVVSSIIEHYNTKVINQAVRLKNTRFDKLELFFIFQIFQILTFKYLTIKHILKLIRFVLFNSNILLNRICEKKA